MIKLLLAALMVLLFTGTAARAWDKHDMNRQIDQTNFSVNKGCSGTLIDKTNGYILTAGHCVEDQTVEADKEITDPDSGKITKEKIRRLRDGMVEQLKFDNGDAVSKADYEVKLIAVDKDKDLALLQTRSKLSNTKEAPLACETPERGDTVFVVGNPLGYLYANVSKGIVSSVDRNYDLLKFGDKDQGKQPLMQVSAGVIGGNSGGSVYNDEGELIGVPVIANSVHETLGWAVPLKVIKTFLSDNKLGALFARCDNSQH